VLGFLQLAHAQTPSFNTFLETDQIDSTEKVIKKYLLIPNTHQYVFNQPQLDSLVFDPPVSAAAAVMDAAFPPAGHRPQKSCG
jgi:hypothetical protein